MRGLVVRRPYTPERGDLVWLQFNPPIGHEQAGRRPALVISPRAYNARVGLALLCPVTSQAKGYPFEVPLPEGIEIQGVVLSDQLKSLDWRARRAQRICSVPIDVMEEVVARILPLIEPEEAPWELHEPIARRPARRHARVTSRRLATGSQAW